MGSRREPGLKPLTARELIHELSEPWVDLDKPITVGICPGGWADAAYVGLVITGVTCTSRGQTLDYDVEVLD